MSLENIVSEIDAEIARLDQAKQLLSGAVTPKRGVGRPRGGSTFVRSPAKPKRRALSAAARAKISAAQKARWAKTKKTKSKTVTPRPEAAK